MNLVKYLHQHWVASAALDALLPAEKVFTGLSSDAARPYTVLSKESAKPLARHNDGSAIEKVLMRMSVFHDEYDGSLVVASEIKSAFEGLALDMDDGCKLLAMHRVEEREEQPDPDHWRFTLDFECLVYLSPST